MALDVQPSMGFVNQPMVNAGDPLENIDIETQNENFNRNALSAVHGLHVSQSPNGGTLVVQKDDGVGMADAEVNDKHPFKVWWADNVREKKDDNGGFVIYLPPGSATIQVQGGDSLNAYDVTVPKDIKNQKNYDGDTSDESIGSGVYYLRVGSDYADIVEKMDPVSGDTKTLELYGCIDFDGEFSFHLVSDLSKLGDGRHLPFGNGETDHDAPTIVHTFKIADLSIERHEDDEGNPVTTGNVAQQFQFSTVSTDKYNMHPWKLGYSKQAGDYFALNFADLEDVAIHGSSSATCPRPGINCPVTTPFKHARVLKDFEDKQFLPGDDVYLTCLSYDGVVQASPREVNSKMFPGLFFSKQDLTSFGEIFSTEENVRKRWQMQSVLLGRLSEDFGDILQVAHSQITFSFSVNAPDANGDGTDYGSEKETDVPDGEEVMYPFKTWWVSDADPSSTRECPKGALVIYLPPNSIQVTGASGNKHATNRGGVDQGSGKFELAYHYPQKFQVGAHVYLVKVGFDYKPLNEVFEVATQEQATQGGGEDSLSAMPLGAGEEEERKALAGSTVSPYPNAQRLGDWDRHSLVTPDVFGDNATRLGKDWVETAKAQANKWVEEAKAGAQKWVTDVHNQLAKTKQLLNAAKEAVKKAREERDAAERERKAQRELAKKQAEKAQIEHRIEVLKGNVSATEKLLDNAEAELHNYKGDKDSSTYKRLVDKVMTLSATLRQRNDDLHRLENEVQDKAKEEEAATAEVENATHNEEEKKKELDEAANNKVRTEVRDGQYGAKCLYAALSWDGRITLHIHADPNTSYGCCLMDAGDDQKQAQPYADQSTILYWIPVAEIGGCLNVQTPQTSGGSVTEYLTYEISVMQKQIGTYFAGNECEAWHVGKINETYETYLAKGQQACVQHEFKGTLDDLPQHEEGAAKSLMFAPTVVLQDPFGQSITSGLVYINVCEKNGELYAPKDELGIEKNCWFSSEEDESGSGGGSSGGGSDSSGSGSGETEYKIHKAPLFFISKDGILRIENGPVRFCSGGGGSDVPQLYDFKPIKVEGAGNLWCVYCPSGADALRYMADMCQFPAVIDTSFIPDPPEEVEGHKGWYKTTVPCSAGQLWLIPSFQVNDAGESAIGTITGSESSKTEKSIGITLEPKLVAYCEVGENGKITNYTRCCSVRTIFAYMTDTDLYGHDLKDGIGQYASITSLERDGSYKGRSYRGGNSALEIYNFHKGGSAVIELEATDNKTVYDKNEKKFKFDFNLSHLIGDKFSDEYQFITRHTDGDLNLAYVDYAKKFHLMFSLSFSMSSLLGDAQEPEDAGEVHYCSVYRRKSRDENDKKRRFFELYNFRDTTGTGVIKTIQNAQKTWLDDQRKLHVGFQGATDKKSEHLSWVLRSKKENKTEICYRDALIMSFNIPRGGLFEIKDFPTPYVQDDKIKRDKKEIKIKAEDPYGGLVYQYYGTIAYLDELRITLPAWSISLPSVWSYLGDEDENGGANKSIHRRNDGANKNVKIFELHNWQNPTGGEFKITGIPVPYIEDKKLKQDKKTLTIDCKPGWRFLYQDSNKELKYLDKLTVSFPSWGCSLPPMISSFLNSNLIGDTNEQNTNYKSVERRIGITKPKIKVFELYNFRGTDGTGVVRTNAAYQEWDQKIDGFKRVKLTLTLDDKAGAYSFVFRCAAGNLAEIRYKNGLNVSLLLPSSMWISYIGDDNTDEGNHSITRRADTDGKNRVFELYHWQEDETDFWNHFLSNPETFWNDDDTTKYTLPYCGDFLVRNGRTLEYHKFTLASIRNVLSCGIDKKSLSVEEGQDQTRLGICGWWREPNEERYVAASCASPDIEPVWGGSGVYGYPLLGNSSGSETFLVRENTGGVDPEYLRIYSPTFYKVLDDYGIDHRCLDLFGEGNANNNNALELYDYDGQLDRNENRTYTIYVEPGSGGGTSQYTLPWGTNPLTWRKLRIEIPEYPDPGGDITHIEEQITIICGDIYNIYSHISVIYDDIDGLISTCEDFEERISALESACENRPCEGHIEWDTQTLIGGWNVEFLKVGYGGISVEGESSFSSDLYVNGNLYATSTLNVCGDTYLNGTFVNSELSVSCGAKIQGDLSVGGTGAFEGAISGGEGLNINGMICGGGDLVVLSGTTHIGDTIVSGSLEALSGAAISGDVLVSGDVSGTSLSLGDYALSPEQLSGLLDLLRRFG